MNKIKIRRLSVPKYTNQRRRKRRKKKEKTDLLNRRFPLPGCGETDEDCKEQTEKTRPRRIRLEILTINSIRDSDRDDGQIKRKEGQRGNPRLNTKKGNRDENHL